jgi:lambda repressor-like predicted transcriptional regulator
MENMTIREAAKEAGLPLWRIAYAMGITDSTMSRKLRKPFPQAEKERVLQIIASLRDKAGDGFEP